MKPSLAIAYARFSPRPVKKKANGEIKACESIDHQLARIRAYCDMHAIEIGLTITEPGVSAYDLDLHQRPRGPELLEAIATRKYRHVVVHRWDRLYRDADRGMMMVKSWGKRIILHLVEQGGCSINTSTGMGRFFLRQIASMAELERDLISERTSQAMSRNAQTKQSGSCRIPWGRMLAEGNALVECAEELQAAARIKAMHAQGLSLREIGRALEDQGILCRGKRWHPSTISGILT